jgi:hypothetical protein
MNIRRAHPFLVCWLGSACPTPLDAETERRGWSDVGTLADRDSWQDDSGGPDQSVLIDSSLIFVPIEPVYAEAARDVTEEYPSNRGADVRSDGDDSEDRPPWDAIIFSIYQGVVAPASRYPSRFPPNKMRPGALSRSCQVARHSCTSSQPHPRQSLHWQLGATTI